MQTAQWYDPDHGRNAGPDALDRMGFAVGGKAALRSFTRSIFKELRPHDVHAALVTIHDTITPGTPYDPEAIALYYWDIASQTPDDWVAEYDFNPTNAQAVDRDL